MVKSWRKLQGEAKPGMMGGVSGENATHNEWMELLSLKTHHTKQVLYQRLTRAERESFQERAALCQYEAGMDRESAEWEALTHIVHYRLFNGRTF